MSLKTYGASGTALTLYPGQPSRVRENGKWGFRFKGWCAVGSVDTIVPADGTGMDASPVSSSFPSASSYWLSKVEIAENQTPGMVDVILTYELAGTTWWWKDGDTEKRCEVILREQSVDDAIAYAAFSGEVDDAKAGNRKTITVPHLKYTYSEYDSSFSWSEANLIAASGVGMGKAGSPTGISSATADRWQFQGTELSESKGLTRRTEHWEYAPEGWPGTPVATTTTTTTTVTT